MEAWLIIITSFSESTNCMYTILTNYLYYSNIVKVEQKFQSENGSPSNKWLGYESLSSLIRIVKHKSRCKAIHSCRELRKEELGGNRSPAPYQTRDCWILAPNNYLWSHMTGMRPPNAAPQHLGTCTTASAPCNMYNREWGCHPYNPPYPSYPSGLYSLCTSRFLNRGEAPSL